MEPGRKISQNLFVSVQRCGNASEPATFSLSRCGEVATENRHHEGPSTENLYPESARNTLLMKWLTQKLFLVAGD